MFGAPVLNEKEQTTDTPDHQVATYEFENFTCVWEHRQFGENQNEKHKIGACFYGTKGVLRYDVPTHKISMGRVDPSKRVRPGQPGEKPALEPVEIPADLRGEWTVEADFVRAIREGGPVYPSFDDGVAYMEFVEAVARSIAEERVIHLPLA